MASKKTRPRISSKPARKARPTEKTLGEAIIEQIQTTNSYLASIAKSLQDRNGMLSVVTGPAPALTTSAPVVVLPPGTHTDDFGVTHLPGAQKASAPRKRGRPSKAELAARAAEAAPPAEQTSFEPAPSFPKMCPCGVREDLPPHLHAKGCPVHFPAEAPPEHASGGYAPLPGMRHHPDTDPAEYDRQAKAHAASPEGKAGQPFQYTPPPSPPPAAQAPATPPAAPLTIDDVRATAIAFVGKHGKEKLAALLQSFGAPNLSALPAEKLPALHAALTNGV